MCVCLGERRHLFQKLSNPKLLNTYSEGSIYTAKLYLQLGMIVQAQRLQLMDLHLWTTLTTTPHLHPSSRTPSFLSVVMSRKRTPSLSCDSCSSLCIIKFLYPSPMPFIRDLTTFRFTCNLNIHDSCSLMSAHRMRDGAAWMTSTSDPWLPGSLRYYSFYLQSRADRCRCRPLARALLCTPAATHYLHVSQPSSGSTQTSTVTSGI